MDAPGTSDQISVWGEFNILYSMLTSSQVQWLEKAIFARRLERSEELRKISETGLPPSHTLPILAIERHLLENR